jgi:transposase-like protein
MSETVFTHNGSVRTDADVATRPLSVIDGQGMEVSGSGGTGKYATRRLKEIVARYQQTAPQLAAWLEQSAPEAITVLMIPPAHRRRLRTTNGLERLNKEIKRRTRVATLFPNKASLLRLASAVLSEISDDWETERAYLTMEAR